MIYGQRVNDSRMFSSCKMKLWKCNWKHVMKIKGVTWSKKPTVVHISQHLPAEKLLGMAVSRIVFWPPLCHIRMLLWLWTVSYQELQSPQGLCQKPCVGRPFPVSVLHNLYSSVLLKHTCQRPSVIPPALRMSYSTGWSRLAASQEVCIQAAGSQLRGPTGQGGLTPITRIGLTWSLLHVGKSIAPPHAWVHCVFLGESDTKMQWAEVDFYSSCLAYWWPLLSCM